MSVRIASGPTFLCRLADALGLSGRAIRRIRVDASIDDAVRVVIDELLDQGPGEDMLAVVRRYRLVEEPEAK